MGAKRLFCFYKHKYIVTYYDQTAHIFLNVVLPPLTPETVFS